MSDVVIRPALQAERSLLEALQWRASLANPGDRDALLANPDAIALPVEQIADGHVFVAGRDGAIVGFAAVLPRPDGTPSSMRCSSSRVSGKAASDDCWSTIAPMSRASAPRASCTSSATRTRKGSIPRAASVLREPSRLDSARVSRWFERSDCLADLPYAFGRLHVRSTHQQQRNDGRGPATRRIANGKT